MNYKDLPPLMSDEFYRSPFGFYEHLQANHPVHWEGQINAWIVTRYQDIMDGLRNPIFSAVRGNSYFGMLSIQEQEELRPLHDFFSKWLLFSDGEFHSRLRKILGKSSFFKSNAEHEHFMRSRANELLIPFSSGDITEMDIMANFATPLSIEVISKILGIDKADFLKVFEWNMNIVWFMGTWKPDMVLGRKALTSYHELVSFAEGLIADLHLEEGKTLLGDLVSYVRKGELSEDELIATLGNILIDGFEPSALSIGHGILALLRNLDQLHLLQEHPEKINSAVYEILRYENAFPYAARRATEDSEVLWAKMKANDRILFVLLAWNRDRQVFDDPHSFMVDRVNAKNHLGLWAGGHACIGRWLAQVTIRAWIEAFVEFSKGRNLEYEMPEYRKSLGIRGFDKLLVRRK